MKIVTAKRQYGKKYVFNVIQNPNNGINNTIFSNFLDLVSKQMRSNNLIIKITINNCPALSVPYSANRVKERLKYVNVKKYKYFIIRLFTPKKISLSRK